MFEKVLIANRGEIALRIIRACRELGIKTVAVYSQADSQSLHVQFADEAICIGPAQSIASYLHIPNLISAAVLSGADAIHPGYGYLSENADFAEICQAHGLVFIGPTPEQIDKLGDKSQAKAQMKAAGVPVLPGSDRIIEDETELLKCCKEIGYPVLIKASAGGGGRGMRLATNEGELLKAYQAARHEAGAVFGNDQVYLEKYIENPRHIEIQLLGDSHGNIVHFGERECSIQRRHQKILEESPSPAINQNLRQLMGQAAVRGAQSVNYLNAGTMEFLLDEEGNFYFMEMNTRIQVEHPITEMVYGIDLVKAQIQIAAGAEISYDQKAIIPMAHAIECRLNAEDPNKNFRPSPGIIDRLYIPGGHGIRWDSHIYHGYEISPYYDPMFGKLITWGEDRDAAIVRMLGALAEIQIRGIKHNITFHQRILENEKFRQGNYSVRLLEEASLRAGS